MSDHPSAQGLADVVLIVQKDEDDDSIAAGREASLRCQSCVQRVGKLELRE